MTSMRPTSPSGSAASPHAAAPHDESTHLTGVLVSGVFLLTASYAPSAYIGMRSPRESDRILAVPAAGPWIDLANRGRCVPEATPIKLPVDSCLPETLARAALVTAGVVEDLGVVLTAVGIPAYPRGSSGERSAAAAPSGVHVTLVPTGTGAAAVGTF
jgi:hypothetical protein